jgi:hypothetical protein
VLIFLVSVQLKSFRIMCQRFTTAARCRPSPLLRPSTMVDPSRHTRQIDRSHAHSNDIWQDFSNKSSERLHLMMASTLSLPAALQCVSPYRYASYLISFLLITFAFHFLIVTRSHVVLPTSSVTLVALPVAYTLHAWSIMPFSQCFKLSM